MIQVIINILASQNNFGMAVLPDPFSKGLVCERLTIDRKHGGGGGGGGGGLYLYYGLIRGRSRGALLLF